MGAYRSGVPVEIAAPVAFALAAAVNYLLSISILFRSRVKWNSGLEIAIYAMVVLVVGAVDLYFTKALLGNGFSPQSAKLLATGLGFILNFIGRKYIVFPEKKAGVWKPQGESMQHTSRQELPVEEES
jgi:putative flippase GtrA